MIKLPLIEKTKKYRILVIAEEEEAKELGKRMIKSCKPKLGSLAYYNLDGNYGVFGEDGELRERPLYCHGPSDGIVKATRETNSNEVFIATPLPYPTVVDTMLSFSGDGVKFMFSPEAYERCMGWAGRNNGWILPAIDLSKGDLSPFCRVAKRCMDILVSIFALIALSPLFVIIPILIKLTSRGPVLFSQERCGHNGRPFKIYKFRTMIAGAERLITKIIDFESLKEPVFKIKNDPRVTPIGRFLRKTSIDELPQLFNVIKGDLSLVGPRPEEKALVRKYNPYLKQRLMVKPGITGLQQVICRGSTSMMERMKYDLAYIKNRSLWLDFKILFRTVWVVALQKRAT